MLLTLLATLSPALPQDDTALEDLAAASATYAQVAVQPEEELALLDARVQRVRVRVTELSALMQGWGEELTALQDRELDQYLGLRARLEGPELEARLLQQRAELEPRRRELESLLALSREDLHDARTRLEALEQRRLLLRLELGSAFEAAPWAKQESAGPKSTALAAPTPQAQAPVASITEHVAPPRSASPATHAPPHLHERALAVANPTYVSVPRTWVRPAQVTTHQVHRSSGRAWLPSLPAPPRFPAPPPLPFGGPSCARR